MAGALIKRAISGVCRKMQRVSRIATLFSGNAPILGADCISSISDEV